MSRVVAWSGGGKGCVGGAHLAYYTHPKFRRRYDRTYLYLVLREKGETGSSGSSPPWRLRLCRIEDDDGEEEDGSTVESRYRLVSQAVISPPPGDLEELDGAWHEWVNSDPIPFIQK